MKRNFYTILLTIAAITASAQPMHLQLAKQGETSVLVNPANQDVLAIFDHDVNSLADMPAEMLSFLELYTTDTENSEDAFVSLGDASTDTIGPLLGPIMFDQGTPYNDRCPVLNGARSLTGCVATAMAQVMAYWKYPAVGTGSATYTSSNGAATYDFTAHPFDWNNILNTYTISPLGSITNYNANQAAAIAELMLACGASVNMDYDASGSGSYISHAYTALKNHFGYSSDIRYLESNDPDWDDWADALRGQFDKGLPILYGGISTGGGHAFVLDGYYIETLQSGNTRTRFHVNWGWNGSQNGWFLLPKLQPEGNDNYSNLNQRLVMNIYPKDHVDVENIETSEHATPDLTKPIYNILGVPVAPSSLHPATIYIQKGVKFML